MTSSVEGTPFIEQRPEGKEPGTRVKEQRTRVKGLGTPANGQRTTSGWSSVLWLILLNIVLRVVWLAVMHPPQLYDFAWYFTHAVDLAQNRGYQAAGSFTAYWPMGYPYFLSLVFRVTGPSVLVGLAINAALSTLIVVLVHRISLLCGLSRAVAFWAALGYTLLPSQIEWNSVLGSEELATVLLLVAVSCYLHARRMTDAVRVGESPSRNTVVPHGASPWHMPIWLVVSGLALGASVDIRPIPALLPIVLLVFERYIAKVSWRVALGRAFLVGIAMCIAVLPLTVRNAIALHHFVPISTNGGVNLWQGTHANGSYYWTWNRAINPLLAAGNNQILENAIATRTAVHYILTHPLLTIRNGFIKWFFLYWVDWNVVSVTFQTVGASAAVVKLAMWFDTIVYWIWMIFAASGLVMLVKRRFRGYTVVLLPLFCILYQTAVFFFFPAWDRFRYPIMPFFAIFLGFALERFVTRRATPFVARFRRTTKVTPLP